MKRTLSTAQLVDKTIKRTFYISDEDGHDALVIETNEDEICIIHYEDGVGPNSYTPTSIHKFNVDMLRAATIISEEEYKELKDKFNLQDAKFRKASAEIVLLDLKKSNPELFDA